MKQHSKEFGAKAFLLYFKLKNNVLFEIKLPLDAELQISENASNCSKNAVNLSFSDGRVLTMVGKSGPFRFQLNPAQVEAPDVLDMRFTNRYFSNLLYGSAEEIKSILTNQLFIRGIGEVFADEILWYAGISPFSTAGRIPEDKIGSLYRKIKYVLLDAIKGTRKIGVQRYHESASQALVIHRDDKLNSPTGKVIKIKQGTVGKTYYTDEQVIYS